MVTVMARIRRKDASRPWSLVVWLYTGPRIFLPVAAVVLATVGTLDSFTDADGARILGALPQIAPGLLSLVHCLMILRGDMTSGYRTARHFLTSAFLSALPVIVVNVLVLIGAWLVPANRALVGPDAQNVWWPGTLLTQTMLTGLGGYASQIGGAFVAFILVVLPIIAVWHPRTIAQGGTLEKLADTSLGKAAILSLVFGFALSLIGGLTVSFTRGVDIESIGFELSSMMRLFTQIGEAPTSDIVWAFGFLLLIIGLAAIAFSIIVASSLGKKTRA